MMVAPEFRAHKMSQLLTDWHKTTVKSGKNDN